MTPLATDALQQHLPFTVLKLIVFKGNGWSIVFVATAPTVYGIETMKYCAGKIVAL